MGASESVAELYGRLQVEAHRALVGQTQVFELLCIGLFAGGHVLLEGVPGTAKTLMAKLLARLVQADFKRVQFTPDLMPSDITGTMVFDLQAARFYLRPGPIFTQILLADEINRAPAKTQAALLEAMEERQVTIEGEEHPLRLPFMVVATQNPIEYEGTYPLPEAQLDRFLLKAVVGYPHPDEEREMLSRWQGGFDARALDAVALTPVVESAELQRAQESIRQIVVDPTVLDYMMRIIGATRADPDVVLGGSPRAAVALLLASRVLAALRGTSYVTPDDVKEMVPPVLRHRISLRAEAEIEGLTPDQVITRLLGQVPVPR